MCLLVDDASFLDIVRNVGNVDTYFIHAIGFAERQRIVEVFGIGRVDGEGKHFAEVLATSYLFGCDARIDAISGFFHILWIFVGQTVLGQDGMHLGIVLACLAQNVDDLAHNVLVLHRGPLGDTHHGFIARLTALELPLRYEHVMDKEVAVADEESEVALHLQLSHHLVVSTTQNLGHHSLFDVVLAPRHHRHPHTIAVESKHRVALGHKDWLVGAIGKERVLAIGLTDEGTFHHLALQVQAETSVRLLLQVVVPRHVLHRVHGQHLRWMGIEVKLLEDLLQRESLILIVLEESLQHLHQLPLGQSFAFVLAFCHNV